MAFKIFVYGTLRRKRGAFHMMERAGAKFLTEARTKPRYQLYSIHDNFPGMVEDDSVEGGVSGEVFEVDPNNLGPINRYEGLSVGLFRMGTVEFEDGSTANAYFFNQSLDECERVESGVWR